MVLERTRAVLEQGIGSQHLGVQVSARLGGDHYQLALGQRERGAAMTNATRLAWFSACKPVLALATCRAWERGDLDLHTPVCDVIPEFAGAALDPERQARKRIVTIWHLLTHTAGFRLVPGVRAGEDWDAQLEAICAAPLEPGWTPGEKAGYHERTGWTLLAEVYRRVAGVRNVADLGTHLHQVAMAPLGAAAASYGRRAPHPAATTQAHSPSSPPLIMDGASPPKPHVSWRARDSFDPAAGVVGPASALSAWYQALTDDDEIRRVVSPLTVQQMVSRQREGLMDQTFKRTMDWGLGFAINSQRHGEQPVPYGFGGYASAATFGHGGMQTTVGFSDPVNTLSAAIIYNGMPGETAHLQRAHQACEALYRDLGLAAT